jgi:hypothetical protein
MFTYIYVVAERLSLYFCPAQLRLSHGSSSSVANTTSVCPNWSRLHCGSSFSTAYTTSRGKGCPCELLFVVNHRHKAITSSW